MFTKNCSNWLRVFHLDQFFATIGKYLNVCKKLPDFSSFIAKYYYISFFRVLLLYLRYMSKTWKNLIFLKIWIWVTGKRKLNIGEWIEQVSYLNSSLSSKQYTTAFRFYLHWPGWEDYKQIFMNVSSALHSTFLQSKNRTLCYKIRGLTPLPGTISQLDTRVTTINKYSIR